jgi:inositol 1,4,5-triphosphate receptor type 1
MKHAPTISVRTYITSTDDCPVFQERCLEWFPRLRAISLAVEDVEGEQNEWRTLHGQLEATQQLVKTLSTQLGDLRDQMTEQRKQKQRIGLLNSAPSLLNLGNGMAASDRC